MHSQIISFGLLAAAPLISGHGLITSATGDLGGESIGLGVKSTEDNTLNDVTVFSSATGFGKTGASGNVVPATLLAAQGNSSVAQVSAASGVLTMVYHQINADGAGPMACSVSADASGDSFATMTVTTNVPGTDGKSTAVSEDFPLVASMPAGTTCTGTVGSVTNACVVKCQNPAGPFGSNLIVQQGAAGSATSSTSAVAAVSNTTATAATAEGKAAKGAKAKDAKGKTAKKEAARNAPRNVETLLESIEQQISTAFSAGSADVAATANAKKGAKGAKKGAASANNATSVAAIANTTAVASNSTAAIAKTAKKGKDKVAPRSLESFVDSILETFDPALAAAEEGAGNATSSAAAAAATTAAAANITAAAINGTAAAINGTAAAVNGTAAAGKAKKAGKAGKAAAKNAKADKIVRVKRGPTMGQFMEF